MQLCYLDRVIQDKRPVPRTFPLMKGWKSEHLQAREDREISAEVFGLGRIKKRYIHNEEQQQGNEEQSLDVDDSGVGSSSQNILPSDMVKNVLKYINQINDGRTNLVRVLKEASSQIKNNDLFGFVCDIARSAIGSQKSPVVSVSDTFLHLSQSFHIDNNVAVHNWKAVFDSIRNAEKENETLEDLNEFPTFRLGDFFDKVST